MEYQEAINHYKKEIGYIKQEVLHHWMEVFIKEQRDKGWNDKEYTRKDLCFKTYHNISANSGITYYFVIWRVETNKVDGGVFATYKNGQNIETIIDSVNLLKTDESFYYIFTHHFFSRYRKRFCKDSKMPIIDAILNFYIMESLAPNPIIPSNNNPGYIKYDNAVAIRDHGDNLWLGKYIKDNEFLIDTFVTKDMLSTDQTEINDAIKPIDEKIMTMVLDDYLKWAKENGYSFGSGTLNETYGKTP